MISLPALPTGPAEKPAKTALPAGIDGLFASVLDGETGNAKAAGGKVLPDSGKDLPDGLPVEALTKQIKAHARFDLKAQPKADGEDAEAAEAADDTDTAIADTASTETATADSAVVAAIALAVQMPVKLERAPRVEVEADAKADKGEKAEQAAGTDAAKADRPERPERIAQPDTARILRQTIDGARGFRTPLRAQTAIAALAARTGASEAAAPAEQAAAAAVESTVVPAIAQAADRAAKPARPQARHEVTLDVLKEAKTAQTEAAAPRAVVAEATQTVQPLATDTAPADQSAKPEVAAAPQQAIRPHEFTALVDRLVEAREAARPANASVTVMHSDFGQVSVSFGQDNGNLTVSLASNDPGFIPAVNAATAADGASNGDASFQGRRDDNGQAARSSADNSNASSGQNGGSREGAGRNFRNDTIRQQPHLAAAARRTSPSGIFA